MPLCKFFYSYLESIFLQKGISVLEFSGEAFTIEAEFAVIQR